MRYLFQFMVILFFCFVGELLSSQIDVCIPSGVYGLVLLFLCLCTKVIKLKDIEAVAEFFISIMPLLFVPAAVGVMEVMFGFNLKTIGAILSVVFISTAVVILLTGLSAQFLINHKRKVK